jgi:hypothetical protein
MNASLPQVFHEQMPCVQVQEVLHVQLVQERVQHVERHGTLGVGCKVLDREVEVRLRRKSESVSPVPFLLHGKRDKSKDVREEWVWI